MIHKLKYWNYECELYICDFCYKRFKTFDIVIEHEKKCINNPENQILLYIPGCNLKIV
jgi:hypothetical protein